MYAACKYVRVQLTNHPPSYILLALFCGDMQRRFFCHFSKPFHSGGNFYVHEVRSAANVFAADVPGSRLRGDQHVRRVLGPFLCGAVRARRRLSGAEDRPDGRRVRAGVRARHGHGRHLPPQERVPGDRPHPGHRERGHERARRRDVHPAGALHPRHRGPFLYRNVHPHRLGRRPRRLPRDGVPPLFLRGNGRRLSVPVRQRGRGGSAVERGLESAHHAALRPRRHGV